MVVGGVVNGLVGRAAAQKKLADIAVGVALFDSVFIAIPACIGYLSRITWTEVLGLLVLIVLTHGIGVWLGSRFAGKVPVQGLKIFVAVFSVCIAIYMLM